jgi:hypothetical protein
VRRRHVFAKHPAQGVVNRDLLGSREHDLIENATLRLLDLDHRLHGAVWLKRSHRFNDE